MLIRKWIILDNECSNVPYPSGEQASATESLREREARGNAGFKQTPVDNKAEYPLCPSCSQPIPQNGFSPSVA